MVVSIAGSRYLSRLVRRIIPIVWPLMYQCATSRRKRPSSLFLPAPLGCQVEQWPLRRFYRPELLNGIVQPRVYPQCILETTRTQCTLNNLGYASVNAGMGEKEDVLQITGTVESVCPYALPAPVVF